MLILYSTYISVFQHSKKVYLILWNRRELDSVLMRESYDDYVIPDQLVSDIQIIQRN